MTDAPYLEAGLCECSVCTADGTQIGAFQSRSTRVLHQKADRARQNVERSTLATVLDMREDGCVENPLWRGRRTSPIDVMQEQPRTVADSHSETLEALINEIRLQKSRYSLPPTLIFVHSPTTPTDMYPGGGWSRGPGAIHDNIAANASTLLYINYLQNIRKDIDKVIAGPKDNRQVLDLLGEEMSRLELFRHAQWAKQQSMTPDPWGLRTRNGVPSYNTGQHTILFPRLESYHIMQLLISLGRCIADR
jgi:hypothetical protein